MAMNGGQQSFHDFGTVEFSNNKAEFNNLGGVRLYLLRGNGQLVATQPTQTPGGHDYNTYLRIQINDVSSGYESECHLLDTPFDHSPDRGAFHCAVNKWHANGSVAFEYSILQSSTVLHLVVGAGALSLTNLTVPNPGSHPTELPWRAHGHARLVDPTQNFSDITKLTIKVVAGSESVTNGKFAGKVRLIGVG